MAPKQQQQQKRQDLYLAKPLTLKSGLKVPNRLVKAAMAESMADGSNGLPTNERLLRAYRTWADGGWGMILTGNVQVDRRYLGSPMDVYIDPPSFASDPALRESVLSAFRKYAEVAKSTSDGSPGPTVLVQINHPGRQSPMGAGTRSLLAKSLAPSAIPLTLGGSGTSSPISYLLTRLLFGTPRELTHPEIKEIISRFAESSLLLAEAGFDGVEIHGAHGYLLSQFLSPRSNKRTDEYGGDPAKRARIVVEIVSAIRDLTRRQFPNFTVGIKVNSVDTQIDGQEGLAELIQQLKLIVDAGVDFVEVSGGSYDDPAMFEGIDYRQDHDGDGGGDAPSSSSSSSSAAGGGEKGADGTGSSSKPSVGKRSSEREAFFQTFSRAIRDALSSATSKDPIPLMLTGGFRTRTGMERALSKHDCDLVGIGRPAVLNPHLPNNILFNTAEVPDQDAVLYAKKITLSGWMGRLSRWVLPRVVGAGYETAWYASQIREIGGNYGSRTGTGTGIGSSGERK